MLKPIRSATDFAGNSFVSVHQLNLESIAAIMQQASRIKNNPFDYKNILRDKLLYSLFYSESTRTRFSTETAWMRLGGQVISVSGTSSTSLVKGETLDHTLEMYAGYQPDAIAIRCREEGLPEYAAKHFPLRSWINCGDGSNEHPTQAMLDLFTIQENFKELKGLKVAFVGDVKHGRTVHSLAQILNLYGVEMTFVAPESLHNQDWFESHNIVYKAQPIENLAEVLLTHDLVYATRPQLERMSQVDKLKYANGVYQISPNMLAGSKTKIMHPLPIDSSHQAEIHKDLDGHPSSLYFKQAANGLWVRMAIFSLLCES